MKKFVMFAAILCFVSPAIAAEPDVPNGPVIVVPEGPHKADPKESGLKEVPAAKPTEPSATVVVTPVPANPEPVKPAPSVTVVVPAAPEKAPQGVVDGKPVVEVVAPVRQLSPDGTDGMVWDPKIKAWIPDPRLAASK